MRANSLFALLFLSAMLSACGGGGSGSSESTTPPLAVDSTPSIEDPAPAPAVPTYNPYLADVDVGGTAVRLVASSTHIFVSGTNDIKVVDIANHSVLTSIPVESVRSLALTGTTLWVARDGAGVQAFDVANPASPQWIADNNTKIERLTVNGKAWGAWRSNGNAYLGQLALKDGQLVVSNVLNVGKADVLGIFKPLDASHLALSAQLLSNFTEELRTVSTSNNNYSATYKTQTMNALTDVAFRNRTLYIGEISYGSNNAALRSFELTSFEKPMPLATKAGSYRAFAWSGDALLAVKDQTIYSLNPITLAQIAEYPAAARPNMMLEVQDKHWIAFDQIGLVEAQFPAPLIQSNQTVAIHFGGLQNYSYNVLQGDVLCQSGIQSLVEIEINMECFAETGYVRLQILGGELLDADNDDQVDAVATPFSGELSLIVSVTDLRLGTAQTSVLGDALFRILGGKLATGTISIEDFTRKADAIAKVWLSGDVNGDSIVDRKDLLTWTPSTNNYAQLALTESQINHYQTALINATNIEVALSEMTGMLVDVSISDYPFTTIAANDQFVVAATSPSNGSGESSVLYLLSASNLSTQHVIDTLPLQGYVTNMKLSGNFLHVGMAGDDDLVIQIADEQLSTVRAVPGCQKAAWDGADLLCANLSNAYRIDASTGSTHWTNNISINFLDSVLSSSDTMAIGAGTSDYFGTLALINADDGSIRAQHTSNDPMSLITPFAITADAVFTNFSTINTINNTRIERRSLSSGAILASTDFNHARIIQSRTLADKFSVVSYDGLFTIGIDDLQIRTSHLIGLSEVRGAALAGDDWLVLTDDGNLLVYGGEAD